MKHCRPERRSGRSTNVCERMDEPSCLPAEVLCRVQREKTSIFQSKNDPEMGRDR